MSTHEYYLYDLGLVVKERALDARRNRDAAPLGTDERTYLSGRLMAFNEVISIMQQQANGFGIPLAELQLEDIEPDRDLL